MSNLLLCVGLICGSIIWAEIVRDCYHALAHHWQPLYRLHVWHHRVFRPDLSVMNEEIYRKAHWYNDVPEALVMLAFSVLPVLLAYYWGFDRPWLGWMGSFYTLAFLSTAIGRGLGIANLDELTDLTHRPGQFASLPAQWRVNRTYHWRHHFDNQKAYYCGTFTFMDKLMGTALSLKGKTIAITGANGTLGRSLLKYLQLRGAKVIALTSGDNAIAIEINGESVPVKTVKWQIGEETQLQNLFESVDILILNHGVNVHGQRTPDAIELAYEVNTFSVWRLMELFFKTVRTNEEIARKEVWVNTSEAEVNPAFSPLYELSKRAIGDLITLRRLDAPCVVRKLILGPFKSNLNPVGIMSADWVARQIIKAVQRDSRNIIITINPLTFIAFPIKEFCVSTYLKLFSRHPKK
jgi:hypothetical protein